MATVGSLAALVGGEVVGDATREIQGVADLASAGPTHLSFVANRRYRKQLAGTKAGAVLVAEPIADPPCPLIVCQNPYLAMASLATQLHRARPRGEGVDAGAHVDATAQVHPTAWIRAGAVIDGEASIGPRSLVGPNCSVGYRARIGADVLMHPGSKVLDGCVLGDRVILQAGAVVGSDGFGYAPDSDGKRHKIPQTGIVEVGDDVEIGANSTVDRATFGATRIGPGTKIDNLVQVAHNVVMGRDCVIVSQSGISGSTELGDRVIMGAQGGVVGHVEIADDVILGARAGVANTIAAAGVYSGTPVMPHRQWLKVAMAQQSVPELRRRVRALERRMAAAESRDQTHDAEQQP